MNGRKFLIFMSLVLAVVALTWGIDQAWAQSPNGNGKGNGKITAAERKAAAARAQALGLLPGVAGLAAAATIPNPTDPGGPGGVPHYFGPYGNWAYSPLPKGPVAVVTLVDGGTGYTDPVVTIDDVYGTGSGATATATVVGGVITAITVDPTGGADYSAPIVTITDSTGTGAAATATIGGNLTGGIHKFVDKVALLGPGGMNNLGQYIPVAVRADWVDSLGVTHPDQDYYEIAVVEYNEKMHTDLPATRQRAYVQLATAAVPGDNVALFQPDGTTPILMPDGVTQARAVDYPHFLGPTIIATSNRAVRVKFHNLLPTDTGGNLFIPVDETVMGSGPGPKDISGADCDPMMDICAKYTQNRAVVHLHGNNTVWISDGTPHQWITPANETTPYKQGVSVRSVPDMDPTSVDAPDDGMTTLYYTNAQSARLMFYHDHAMAITRLNVYAGMAAGYVVTDPVEQDMINGTNNTEVNPGLLKVLPDIGIPLVIQDRTFVDNDTIWAQDPTWNWGTGPRDLSTGRITTAVTGDLWVPHVYMSAQNPWDLSGTNAFGRWHYGPWFINQTPTCDASGLPAGCIAVGPVANPYYQPDCDLVPPGAGCTAPWEPPLMPGTPNPSMPGEAFNDTPTVNGTVYPYMDVEPRAYRFRILNAANDRFFNLQLYVAADKKFRTTAGTTDNVLCDGINVVPQGDCTEVRMVPVSVAPANQQADWPSGLPDPATKGPDWIQIGTEGGFLSKPAVIPQQPIGWNLNPTTFNFGNVNQHSLLLGTAERADVVVDFSAFAGKTLILYNDSPAAFPAGVPSYDYYTGTPDQMDTGGAPTTQPGYGPNTRTIMQIRVAAAVTPGAETPDVTLANLNAVFAKSATKRGAFEVSQDPIIVPQAAYNSTYNNTFSATARGQYLQLADAQMTFKPIYDNGALQPFTVTMPLEMKAMHDEMGGVYDTQFGRMSGMLGLTNPASAAHILIPYGYASPPTDVISGSISGSQIGSFPDGTQIWRIFHNGVDTHTIHVHLFNAQLINRVGQDGMMLPPDPNELGWKDTFRVNPLEVTFIAMRPIVPTPAQVPFPVPNSIRLIDPTLPDGAPLPPPPPAGWFGPDGNNINVFNHSVNFGWEYVWHCHILAHEEMDMMHSLAYAVPPNAPTGLTASIAGNGNNKRAVLNWTDASLNETGFTIQRAANDLFTGALTTFTVGPNVTTFSNTIGNTNQTYYYRVFATNTVGDTAVYAGSTGFPTKTASSGFSIPAGVNLPPAAPSNVNVTGAALNATRARFTVTWQDNSNPPAAETGFRIQWATNTAFTVGVGTATVAANTTSYQTPNGGNALQRGTTYYFQVQSYNASGTSVYVNYGAPTGISMP